MRHGCDVLVQITVKIRPMFCKDIVKQDTEWSNHQFAIKEGVHCHQRDLENVNKMETKINNTVLHLWTQKTWKKCILCNFLYNWKTKCNLSLVWLKDKMEIFLKVYLFHNILQWTFSPAAEAKQERTRSRNSSTLSLSPAGRTRSETCTDDN